ncbi:hypothetical protein [Pelagibius sp. Alg239-R121]|uniref:hypothetical protein n=1 Tax=Pelagibius sp. Alg239-R121 TaxID=2993448 RepID=UPI0024A786CE|nr:hypothetical protein [Pelagibius sp. Alg239-R121]
MKHYDLVIVGGSVGCLVAAVQSARTGKRVKLFLPERGVGSGFGARPFKGRRLDIGTRVFDLNAPPKSSSPASSLDKYRGNEDFRLFMPHIRAFVEELLQGAVEDLPPAQLSYGGKLVPEFLASLDLSSLPQLLNQHQIAQVREETAEILVHELNGTPVLGRSSELNFAGLGYQLLSLANHGKSFHDLFIAPYSAKIYPENWQEVPADLRHKIWSPIFYPKTLNQACDGRLERGRETLTFSTVRDGDFGVFVDRLMTRIEAAPDIELDRFSKFLGLAPEAGGHSLSFEGQEIPARVSGQLVLGLSVADIVALNGHSAEIDMLSLGVAWAEVSESDINSAASYVTVHDPDNPAYRLSFGGSGAPSGKRIANVELSCRVPREDYETAVRFALEQSGILREGAAIEMLDGIAGVRIPAPTQRNRLSLEQAKQRLSDNGVEADYIGTARDMSRDILNQHILQGLALAT